MDFTPINTVDIGQKDIARRPHHTNLVLNVQGHLKIFTPVASFMAVVGQNGVIHKNFEAVKVGTQPVQHDDIGRNQQKVARQG